MANPDLQISGGPGQPDPEIRGGEGGGAVSKKSFSGPSGLILVEKQGGAGPQSSEISQTIVYKSLSNFANLWSQIFVSF